jgi:hypothetical protein
MPDQASKLGDKDDDVRYIANSRHLQHSTVFLMLKLPSSSKSHIPRAALPLCKLNLPRSINTTRSQRTILSTHLSSSKSKLPTGVVAQRRHTIAVSTIAPVLSIGETAMIGARHVAHTTGKAYTRTQLPQGRRACRVAELAFLQLVHEYHVHVHLTAAHIRRVVLSEPCGSWTEWC